MVIIGASQALDPGSIPGRRNCGFFQRGISSIGRVRALQARGTGIETPMLHFGRAGAAASARRVFCGRALALIAQLVEHGSNKPRVGGSSPSWSI